MFVLRNNKGETLKMKNGDPFTYSSKELANRAKVLLENNLKIRLVVVPV